MQEMDRVEIVVEKNKYTKEGVHKGMQGWICHDECSFGYWLVNFPQMGDKPDIATLSVKEEDLRIIPVMNTIVNEQIKAQFDDSEKTFENSGNSDVYKKIDDISDYMV